MDIDQSEKTEPMHTPTFPALSPEHDGIASFLPPGFTSLEDYLACLQSFLDRCEPITSLMIVDYFTTNSWESRMPQDWREAFESKKGKLSSLDLMELVSLGRLRDYNAPPAGSDGSSSNTLEEQEDAGPQDWPESLKDFVRMVKELSINRTLDPDYAKFKDTLDIHLTPGMSPKKLHEVEILSGLMASYAKEHSIRSVIDLGAGQGYLSRVLAFQHQLCVLGVDSNTIQTCGAQTTQKRTEKLFVNKTTKLKRAGGGGSKKASKQSRLAAASSASQSPSPSPAVSPPPPPPAAAATGEVSIAEAATTATTAAVPILSTVDSTLVTSSSAPSTPLMQQTAELGFESPVDKVCKKLKTEESRSRSSSPATDSCGGNSSGGTGGVVKKASRSRRSKTRKTEDGSHIPNTELNLDSSNTTSSNAGPESKATGVAKRGKPNTPGSTPTTDASMTLAGQKTIDSSNDPSLAATPGSNFQLQHITHHITAATLPTLLKEHFPKKSKVVSDDPNNHHDGEGSEKVHQGEGEGEMDDEEGRWTLCGLHACGDLTSNMIKLFLESSATCLFSVGCCYHWITERYDRDGNIVISDGTHGFPLSAAFNLHKAHLGEHAKMIACQSPERWLKYQKESEDAIHGHYFRALLHKLMVERGLYPGPPTTAPVLGRMGKHRLRGFPHYLATALHRLSLPADAIRPEEAQAAYEEFLEKDLYRIGILWALRTMLGPLFEGMILLDRATYLHENVVGQDLKTPHTSSSSNKKKASVQLVAGFDVVESPRNMILIALKD
ncbi:Methyltransferase-like protein 25 [Mortierella alpina]|nr:Methyltransferase-like protein 25 [Mortierella alpina]